MDNSTLIMILWPISGAIGVAILGLFFWGIRKLLTLLFETVVEVKLLRQEMSALIKLPARVDKNEKDITAAHDRIRAIIKP